MNYRITNSLLNADSAGALVTFNDILFQGFDGHLFVSDSPDTTRPAGKTLAQFLCWR